MANLKDVGGINWKVRLQNPQFVFRTAAAILLPALVFLGIDPQMLTSWEMFGDAVMQVIMSPVAVGIIILNIVNLIPDPTRDKLQDSMLVRGRETPKVEKHN